MNLEKIQSFIDQKTIKSSDTINMELLKKLKLINKNSQKLKILGTGEVKVKVNTSGKGFLSISFDSQEDLNRIVNKINNSV